MDPSEYFERLYPLQDAVLASFARADTGFYLTGSTAASRGYLNHRFSDDLDLFVNDDPRFGLWADRLITAAVEAAPAWRVQVGLRDPRFVRFVVSTASLDLKVELVSDVPSHVGALTTHPVLGRLDSAENILANKLTALADRREPKDLADVWGSAASWACRSRRRFREPTARPRAFSRSTSRDACCGPRPPITASCDGSQPHPSRSSWRA